MLGAPPGPRLGLPAAAKPISQAQRNAETLFETKNVVDIREVRRSGGLGRAAGGGGRCAAPRCARAPRRGAARRPCAHRP
jgi:hypothetical protein